MTEKSHTTDKDRIAELEKQLDEAQITIGTLCRINECHKCKVLEKEINRQKGFVEFHKGEQKSWRKLFEEQRGGETFNNMQKRVVDVESQLREAKSQLKAAAKD
jgi:hypothetical protein